MHGIHSVTNSTAPLQGSPVLVKGQMDSGRTCNDLDQSGRPTCGKGTMNQDGAKIQGADKRCARALLSALRPYEREHVASICCDDWNHELDPVTSYLACFFNSVVKHQGRTMKKRDCALGRMCAFKICKEYNRVALMYQDLVRRHNELVEYHNYIARKYNELKTKEDQ